MPPRIGQRSPDPDCVRARLVPLDGAAPADLDRDQTSIGTAPDNHVVLAATTVSRHHALLARNERAYRLVDLGSTNGTYVNGRRIDGSTQVRPGDEIRFGTARFVLRNRPDTLAMPAPARRFSPLVLSALVAIFFVASFGLADFVLNFNRLDQAESGSDASPPSAVPWEEPAARPSGEPAGAATTVSAESPSPEVLAWLEPLNRYRAMAGLAAVTADATLGHGDFLHSRYLVKNFADDIRKGVNLGARMHSEEPGNRWYTADGFTAARSGDVDEMWDPHGNPKPSWAIDNWMQVPFHRLTILNPDLHRVGYGSYCEGAVCVASLNVITDADPVSSKPRPLASPVKFPPDGTSIRSWNFEPEWPDPLAGCPGYDGNAGIPITLQLGAMATPTISRYALTRDGVPVDACEFDANTYRNPDPDTQSRARVSLAAYGGIVLIPRAALTPGAYSVSISTAARTYAWSFTITP